jgi:MFS family permease
LRTSLSAPGFRRLLAVRLLGQFGDGIFQASLAGAVLFNPEHQATAADVAAGFAVVLLPYSVVGPFAGVLLDRWRRQRTLVVTNLVRAASVVVVAAETTSGVHGLPFYASALVVVSLSRFVLSGLSAAQPHLLSVDNLVTANAFATTTGTIATTTGGAAAIGVRALTGATNHGYAIIALAAAVTYAAAARLAQPFGADDLGPDDVERNRRETVADVARGLAAGAREVQARPHLAIALVAITAHRLCYGVTTVCTVLLYRNYFHDDGVLRSGLTGLAQVVGAAALGGGIAAVVTPVATRRIGYVRWPALLFVGGGVVQLAFGLPFRMALLVAGAVPLGVVAQGVKICVDTLVQRELPDVFRGRVFALYDMLFNVMLVVAAALTAAVLPSDGRSPTGVVVISVGYLLIGLGYAVFATRRQVSPAGRTTG